MQCFVETVTDAELDDDSDDSSNDSDTITLHSGSFVSNDPQEDGDGNSDVDGADDDDGGGGDGVGDSSDVAHNQSIHNVPRKIFITLINFL